jgi:putative transposase
MVAGGHYHIINRGNNRATVFATHGDYAGFVRLMEQAQQRVGLRILAACLMPNHFHVVASQGRADDISRWMHWLLTTSSRHHHDRNGSSGRLWQGRFKAFPIEHDGHLLTVMRYVERNALRADLVRQAEDWPWGSLAWRQRPSRGLLAAPPLPLPSDWIQRVNSPQTPEELAALRDCVNRQRPFGNDEWVDETAACHGLEWTVRPRGRPRKPRPPTGPR